MTVFLSFNRDDIRMMLQEALGVRFQYILQYAQAHKGKDYEQFLSKLTAEERQSMF